MYYTFVFVFSRGEKPLLHHRAFLGFLLDGWQCFISTHIRNSTKDTFISLWHTLCRTSDLKLQSNVYFSCYNFSPVHVGVGWLTKSFIMLYCDVPVDSCSSNGGTFVLFVPAEKAVSLQVSDFAWDAFMYVAFMTTLWSSRRRKVSISHLFVHINDGTMSTRPSARAPWSSKLADLCVSWVLNFHHVCSWISFPETFIAFAAYAQTQKR